MPFDPFQTTPTCLYMGVPIWVTKEDGQPSRFQAFIDWHGRHQAIYPAERDPAAFQLVMQARQVIDLLIDIELRGWLNDAGLARQELCG